MASVKGFVEKIKYRNEENGYTVLSLTGSDDGEEYILVGNFSFIGEGELLEASGHMTEHPVYGEQLSVESYEIKPPEDTVSMERYLGSGAIKGIGAALASRIVKKFKKDTFRIMEEEPERLAEIKGISEKMAMSIGEQIEEKRDMRQAMMFLQDYGVSMNLAAKIYREYGPAMYGIIKQNPYKLADDIPGVGFKMADEIAARAGILTDSDFRIKSGILYTLFRASGNGHTYLPKEILTAQAAELLGVDPEEIENRLMDMQMEKRLVVKRSREETGREQAAHEEPAKEAEELLGSLDGDGEAWEEQTDQGRQLVYASQYYYTELNTAKMLHDLNITGDQPEESIRKSLKTIQEQEHIELDELQVQAVIEAVNCGLLIITGGPGTGKTTTINTIIRYFELERPGYPAGGSHRPGGQAHDGSHRL